MDVVDEGDTGGRRMLIAHLVRDPRAVVHSQMSTFRNLDGKYRRFFLPGAEPIEESATAEVTTGKRPEKCKRTLYPVGLVDIGEPWTRLAWYLRGLGSTLLMNIQTHVLRKLYPPPRVRRTEFTRAWRYSPTFGTFFAQDGPLPCFKCKKEKT